MRRAWRFVLAVLVLPARALGGMLRAAGRWPPLARLRARVSRQPPALALLLFLVPEAVSRSGWVASTWLLLLGRPWQALALYAATKLLAGGAALWVYLAAEPALLRIRWFAAVHGVVHGARRALVRRVGRWFGLTARDDA